MYKLFNENLKVTVKMYRFLNESYFENVKRFWKKMHRICIFYIFSIAEGVYNQLEQICVDIF